MATKLSKASEVKIIDVRDCQKAVVRFGIIPVLAELLLV